jgi:capsular polysaccharide export protein
VIKHHPLDRGYRDYTKLIRQIRNEHALEGRLLYVHDLHLPSLLKNTIGVVVINSTAGLSALFHGAPVKVCGRAIYDICGLTFQGSLKRFWTEAETFVSDHELYRTFRRHVIRHTQVNGNFYRRLPHSVFRTGVCWDDEDARNETAIGANADIAARFANSKLR